MNDPLPAHQTDSSRIGDSTSPPNGHDPTPLVFAGFVLVGAALLAVAHAGGTLNVTWTGFTLTVNPRR